MRTIRGANSYNNDGGILRGIRRKGLPDLGVGQLRAGEHRTGLFKMAKHRFAAKEGG